MTDETQEPDEPEAADESPAPEEVEAEPAGPASSAEEARTVDADGPSKDERNLAMLAHLGPVVAMLLTGGTLAWVVPLVIYLLKKDESDFLRDQAAEALNFQITIFIATVISAVLIFVGIGLCLLPLVLVAEIVFCILAAVRASDGERYRYPANLRFIS
jgi:uncharacterized Tic20 family protein